MLLALKNEPLEKAAKAAKMVKSVGGLCVPKPKLKYRKSAHTPGIARSGSKCRWEPELHRLWRINDGPWIDVVED